MSCCQQDELYRAEESVVAQISHPIEASELQDYVDWIRDFPWFERNFPNLRRIEAFTRKTNKSGSCGGIVEVGFGKIEMAPVHLTELYVIHEVCHVLSQERFGYGSHSPWFARLYLEAVWTYMRSDAYVELRKAFGRHGVDHDTMNTHPAGLVL